MYVLVKLSFAFFSNKFSSNDLRDSANKQKKKPVANPDWCFLVIYYWDCYAKTIRLLANIYHLPPLRCKRWFATWNMFGGYNFAERIILVLKRNTVLWGFQTPILYSILSLKLNILSSNIALDIVSGDLKNETQIVCNKNDTRGYMFRYSDH